jgi:diacylglycerol kinase family enzyme
MVIHGSGKLKTLMVFPSLFKGEHIAHGDIVEILQGHEISVQYDRPTPLQVDGETIPEVWYCCVRSSKEKSRMDPA